MVPARILVAEDDNSLARALAAILEKAHYAVDVVSDGAEALDYLESSLYDAVILDIMMPNVDGLTVLKTMRRKNSFIPVLLLTAKAEIDDKVAGLDSGANDYLTKPFDARELLARLRSITRMPEKQNDTVMKYGNVSLDDTTFLLSTPSGSYKLANKEFQMMKMFLCNPNQTISADRFMEKIWSADSSSEQNTVWTYVSYLRRKLEALNADVCIATRRNQGYVLEKRL